MELEPGLIIDFKLSFTNNDQLPKQLLAQIAYPFIDIKKK